MNNRISAKIGLTKYIDSFTGQNGEQVKFEYVEVEFAPNCYCQFKLNNSNKRALQKYAPNMFQLLMNIPAGTQIGFEEMPLADDNGRSIAEIYKEAQESGDNML